MHNNNRPMPTTHHPADDQARRTLVQLAATTGLAVAGGTLRRTSSRFCFGVEHGDYNGTELFGVGTDRFIWLAFRPNDTGRVRFASSKFIADGIIDFRLGDGPPPGSIRDSWARFPLGVDHVLRRAGYRLTGGFDAVDFGNIPGGGMSRSASLTINLILAFLDASGIPAPDGMRLVDLAQAVENDYIGSPCGKLDQLMIYFAKADHGTHYNPATGAVRHLPLGAGADDFRLVSLDTGTVRPGLEKSTYKVRRAECEELVALAAPEFGIRQLADVRAAALRDRLGARFGPTHPHLLARLRYLYAAQERFAAMLRAWRAGDIAAVGQIFRQDGLGLRDDYRISGPELETMCDIARTVPGVLGERMLGGGDKGAAGAIVRPDSVEALRAAVGLAYPRSHPEFADRWAVHECRMVDGVADLAPL